MLALENPQLTSTREFMSLKRADGGYTSFRQKEMIQGLNQLNRQYIASQQGAY